MNDYIFFMHDDARENGEHNCDAAWDAYFAMLRASGHFSGGSSIGSGVCITRSGAAKGITSHLSGYIRVQAEDFEQVKKLLVGNPVLESGGTVEIRELPRG
jgi:hypothetical protein